MNVKNMFLLSFLARVKFLNSYKAFSGKIEYYKYEDLSVIVKVPFCNKKCKNCNIYNGTDQVSKCNEYIDAVIKQIKAVTENEVEKKEIINLSFSGGSVGILTERLEEIILEIKKKFIITGKIYVDICHSEVTIPILTRLKEAGVNEINISLISSNKKLLKQLGKEEHDLPTMKHALEKVIFDNIRVGTIFGVTNQKAEDLINDIELAFSLGANNFFMNSFNNIKYENTNLKSFTKKELEELIYQFTQYTEKQGYYRENFFFYGKTDRQIKAYKKERNFLFFGMGVNAVFGNQTITGKHTIEEYIKDIEKSEENTSRQSYISKRHSMLRYILSKNYGEINKNEFKEIFGIEIKKAFRIIMLYWKILGLYTDDGENIIFNKKAYVYFYYKFML